VDVQEVRWDKEDTERAGDYNFIYEKEKRIINLGSVFFCTPQNSISSLLFGYFNAKFWNEDTSKPTIWNDSLH